MSTVPPWEYHVHTDEEWAGEIAVERWLNEMAAKGWELVHLSQSMRTFILKRRKPPARKRKLRPGKTGPAFRSLDIK